MKQKSFVISFVGVQNLTEVLNMAVLNSKSKQ